ncbi:MAG TPA: AzlC family ABC transporter permease [Thermoleophilaceae bacterium]|jgi:4-azaleucine resistance transporter AzlC
MAAATTYRQGMRAGLPFLLPTLAIGVSFGVVTRSLGWDLGAPIVMSAIVYSGSAQFASSSVLGDGGTVFAAVLAAALVNARFLPMGIAFAPSLEGGPVRRAIEGQAVVDASWALANRGGRFDRKLLIGATLPQYVGWFAGTVIGALAGSAIGDPDKLGLDAMFPAFFLALLVPELQESRRARGAALIGGALALALTPLAPPGIPIVAASLAALVGVRQR